MNRDDGIDLVQWQQHCCTVAIHWVSWVTWWH